MRHLGASGGQGLTEVVAVLGVFGSLVAVAVPGYLGMQNRKADKAAKAHLRAAVWTAETYRVGHGSFAGLDTLDLLRIDPRTPPSLTVASARRARYCLTDNVRGRIWSIAGPSRGAHKLTANATCTP